MSDRHYRSEYSFLVEEGHEFAQRYPDLARELNLTDARSRDPNVERLMEGFAFLTSRINKRLDDDLPQLVDGLLSLIWPHHGLPIPSFCLMEFSAAGGQLNKGVEVPAGVELDSEELEDGVLCRYRTCSEVWVPPLSLDQISVEPLGARSRMTLGFKTPPGAASRQFAGRRIRVQILGELSLGLQLYDLLLGREGPGRRLEKVSLVGRADQDGHKISLGPEAISPAGLRRDEALIKRGNNSFWSFGLLEDYFAFKDKFLAFELNIGDALAGMDSLADFDLELELNHPWPGELRVRPENLRLGCVPAVNLFQMDGEPIRVDHLRSHYKIQVDIQNPGRYQVFEVDRVDGIGSVDGRRRKYQPLLAARNRLGGRAEKLQGPFYALSRGDFPGAAGGAGRKAGTKSSPERRGAYLSLLDPAAKGTLPQEETLSLGLTVSNGPLGSKPLPGQINRAVGKLPDVLGVRNLTQPTPAALPANSRSSLWSWLGHAALNYQNLTSAEQLQSLLSQYLPVEDPGNQRRIEGVSAVESRVVRERVSGSLVRGNLLEIELDEDYFNGMGDIQLFAGVLAGFLRAYATINSFVRLVVKLNPSGKKIVMPSSLDEAGQ